MTYTVGLGPNPKLENSFAGDIPRLVRHQPVDPGAYMTRREGRTDGINPLPAAPWFMPIGFDSARRSRVGGGGVCR